MTPTYETEATKAIEAALREDKNQRNVDIVNKLGVSKSAVSRARARLGLFKNNISAEAGFKVILSDENMKFVQAEANEANVGLAELVEAIITDARCEGE